MPSTAASCPRLTTLAADWPAIDAAFEGRPGLPLVQAWRETPEAGLRSGWAWFGHREESLCVKAELHDDDVFNPVTAFNQPAYERGDVVEVFLRPPASPYYYEIHSTPGGALLQLRFRVAEPRKPIPGSPVATPVTRVLTRRTPQGWSAYLEIPFTLVEAAPAFGEEWRMAVCRYDYTRGIPKPVLSSTAAFSRLDYHQPDEWNPIRFVGA